MNQFKHLSEADQSLIFNYVATRLMDEKRLMLGDLIFELNSIICAAKPDDEKLKDIVDYLKKRNGFR